MFQQISDLTELIHALKTTENLNWVEMLYWRRDLNVIEITNLATI